MLIQVGPSLPTASSLCFDKLLHFLPDDRWLWCTSLCYHSHTPQLSLIPTTLFFHQLHIPEYKQGALWWGTRGQTPLAPLPPPLAAAALDRVFSICRGPCGVGTTAARWVWGRMESRGTISQPSRGQRSFPKAFPSLDNANNSHLNSIAHILQGIVLQVLIWQNNCSQILAQGSDHSSVIPAFVI